MLAMGHGTDSSTTLCSVLWSWLLLLSIWRKLLKLSTFITTDKDCSWLDARPVHLLVGDHVINLELSS